MRRWGIFGLLLLAAPLLRAQEQKEYLDSTVVTARRSGQALVLSSPLQTTVNLGRIQGIPSVLGNSDPLRFVKLLPGVQTGTEIDSGIHIQGSEHSHAAITAGGVPIYGATHILGFFSTFISTHYTQMDYTPVAWHYNRLSGGIDMGLPSHNTGRFHGSVSVGLLNGEGTLEVPLGKKSTLFVSARKSYVNLLYSRFLRIGDNPIKYSFFDGNATWFWQPSSRDKVWIDVYGGGDNANFVTGSSAINFSIRWHSLLTAAHWEHAFSHVRLRQSLYRSSFGMTLDFNQLFFKAQLPSDLQTIAYRGQLWSGPWEGGWEVAWHDAFPIGVHLQSVPYNRDYGEARQRAIEATVQTRYNWEITPLFSISPGLKAVWWQGNGHRYPALLPDIRIKWLTLAGTWELQGGLRRQYLFQTGPSNIGMPCEFWFLAGEFSAPQMSQDVSLSWNMGLKGGAYGLSASVYYRHMQNLVEYVGTGMDYADEDFRLRDHLLGADGQNYGVTLLAQKQAGALTGWIGYAFSRSLRTIDGVTVPSNHERIHEVDAVGTYSWKKWDFGLSLVAATGVPFTPADSFYLAGDQLITHFAPRNSRRMSPYFRADISVSYYFRRDNRLTSKLTLSVYNANFRKNDVGYRLIISKDGQWYSYEPFDVVAPLLPSLHYTLSF